MPQSFLAVPCNRGESGTRPRHLVVNADGYGFTPGVNRGIEEAIEAGVVTSISVNANFDSVKPLTRLIEGHPEISVGVHLNPIVGRPLAPARDVPTLVTGSGELHFEAFMLRLRRGVIDLSELELELRLQVERVLELVPTVTHLDSHRNAHLWPRFFKVFLRLARAYGIDRMRTHDHFMCPECPRRLRCAAAFYATHPRSIATHGLARLLMARARRHGMRMCNRLLSPGVCGGSRGRGSVDMWLAIARTCPEGTNELYCHPGYVDAELRRWARTIVDQRVDELRALTNPRVREAFAASDVRLISFYDV